MSGKRYTIELTNEEREQVNRLIRAGKHAARIATRARILLRIDEGWKVATDRSGPGTFPKAPCTGSSGGTPRRVWTACCGIGSKPTVSASWTRRGRPT